MLMLYIVYGIENPNTVSGVKVERNGVAPLTFELGFHSQRSLDLQILPPSIQDTMFGTITFEEQVS